MAEKALLRGLDSPAHLLAWMREAGRAYLVLRVADVLDMTEQDQRLWIQIVGAATGGGDPAVAKGAAMTGAALRSAIQGMGTNGYIRLARADLCSLSLDDLQVVQQFLTIYRDVRLGKGEPSRTDPCKDCGGTGRVGRSECRQCGGHGQIITFLEISEEEARLSQVDV